MNKICTSLEQSKQLIELGIDINTSDMYWEYNHNIHAYDDIPRVVVINNWDDVNKKDFPAWSLSALMHLMPKHYVVEKCSNSYCCYIFSIKGIFANTAVDAAFKMVCWLLENKKL